MKHPQNCGFAQEGGPDYPSVSPAHVHAPACTLEAYAQTKRLPKPFLESLRLSDITYMKLPAVRISYQDQAGAEPAVRIRTALEKSENEDNRFCWKKGSKPPCCMNEQVGNRDRVA